MKGTFQEWMEKPADIQLLLDSGMLFEINRTMLHPLGLSITARKDEHGKLMLDIKDARSLPSTLTFDKDTRDRCRAKYMKFLKEFAMPQMDKRIKNLGWACQPVPANIG